MNGLAPTTQQRVLAHMAAHLRLPADTFIGPRTTIHVSDKRTRDGNQLVWRVGEVVVVSTHADYEHIFQQARTHPDSNPALTVPDVARIEDRFALGTADKLLTVDRSCFVDAPVPDGFTVRPASPEDNAAFQAFLETCSEAERTEGEVGLDDEVAYAAFDGTRMVALASSYEHIGMIDIGVLTDPAYRGRGLGRAVVAAISRHYLDDPDEARLLLYRHEITNTGSQRLALSVGYQLFSQIDYLRFRDVK